MGLREKLEVVTVDFRPLNQVDFLDLYEGNLPGKKEVKRELNIANLVESD